jgi:hypothetical protein
MQRMPPPFDVVTRDRMYRQYLRRLPVNLLLNDRGSWTEHGYHGWLNKEERTRIWREVLDERTLLRPASAGPMTNTDLLIAR